MTHRSISQKSYSPSFPVGACGRASTTTSPKSPNNGAPPPNHFEHRITEPKHELHSDPTQKVNPQKTERDKGVRARTRRGFSIGEQGEGNRPPYSGSSALQHHRAHRRVGGWLHHRRLNVTRSPLLFFVFYPLNPSCTDALAFVLPAEWARAK